MSSAVSKIVEWTKKHRLRYKLIVTKIRFTKSFFFLNELNTVNGLTLPYNDKVKSFRITHISVTRKYVQWWKNSVCSNPLG